MASDYPYPPAPQQSQRMLAGILAILLGGFGVHKFVLGMPVPGIIVLVVSLFGLMGCVASLFCLPFFVLMMANVVTGIIGLIEGIIYLTKTDEEFIRVYQVGKKQWF